jgi:hypothetical protein
MVVDIAFGFIPIPCWNIGCICLSADAHCSPTLDCSIICCRFGELVAASPVLCKLIIFAAHESGA